MGHPTPCMLYVIQQLTFHILLILMKEKKYNKQQVLDLYSFSFILSYERLKCVRLCSLESLDPNNFEITCIGLKSYLNRYV